MTARPFGHFKKRNNYNHLLNFPVSMSTPILMATHGHSATALTRLYDNKSTLVNRRAPIRETASGRALLALEAKRLRYAFAYDPVLAMSVSKVDPLPHQIEAVYGHVLRKPRVRFMLAHDPGAGKTIMAGLIIKEMKLRGTAKRILIVVPGQLKEQWRWEMKDKIDEDFEVVDRKYFNRVGSDESWSADQIITSIDFAKRDDVLKSLDSASFDMVIVDEAHKMSAYSYGKTTAKTKRYRLGEALSAAGTNLLFLTATPHKGDRNNFRLLMDLLEPGFFAEDSMMEESIRDMDNPLFLRRAKEGMTDFDGAPLFVPRTVSTPDVKMSRAEKSLYDAMSKYVREQYDLASRSSKGHNVTFALIILQRRFASSPYALLRSLKRRKARLEELYRTGKHPGNVRQSGKDLESVEEMTEAERWAEEEKWEVLSMAQNLEDLQEEIGTVDKLISKTEKVEGRRSETKLAYLKEMMQEMDRTQPDEKVLVFTESRDTMEYLVRNMAGWGYSVNTIHGAMPSKERKDAEAVFRDKTRVMVATEAAGEGINLQFCHIMINYDLPWNPNRLEQRMGRIHRYGQKHPVSVFNMVASDTREGQIMQRLFEKLDEIKEVMGSDKIFDVISEVVPGKSLSNMLLEATVRAREQKDIMKDLDAYVTAENDQIRDYLEDSLSAKYVDRTMLEDFRGEAQEKSLVPEYSMNLFADVLEAAGGRVINKNGMVASIILPPEIAALARERHGMPEASQLDTVTFDKRVRMANPGTELVTFGHPAFDAALDWAEREYLDDVMAGATFTDPSGRMDGYVVYCQGDVIDGQGTVAGRRLSACLVDSKGHARDVSPAVLLDLEPSLAEPELDVPEDVLEAAVSESANMLEEYVGSISKERLKYAGSMQKYGVSSIDTLLDRVSDDIARLLDKKRIGMSMDLAIYNKREERKRHRLARHRLKTRTDADMELSACAPSVAGVVRVIPGDSGRRATWMALESAMSFEKASGRNPEDVSGTGRGFDIRSTDGAGVRYVLAKPAKPRINLTQNEWLRSKTLGNASYLYLVDSDGKISRTVVNPAAVLLCAKTASGYVADTGMA